MNKYKIDCEAIIRYGLSANDSITIYDVYYMAQKLRERLSGVLVEAGGPELRKALEKMSGIVRTANPQRNPGYIILKKTAVALHFGAFKPASLEALYYDYGPELRTALIAVAEDLRDKYDYIRWMHDCYVPRSVIEDGAPDYQALLDTVGGLKSMQNSVNNVSRPTVPVHMKKPRRFTPVDIMVFIVFPAILGWLICNAIIR